MCGRTSLFVALEDLEELFSATYTADRSYEPRYNIAPGAELEVVTNDDPDAITQERWGLLTPWMDDDDKGYINARSETAHEKRSFKSAWAERPCLILSSGFYEWQAQKSGPKHPYRVYRDSEPAFAMAGLWEPIETDDGESFLTVTILTTEPNDVVEPIHDRMPVILPRDEEQEWLEAGPDERHELCRPYPDDDLEAYPISTAVNNPTNDSPSVIEPLETEQSGLGDYAYRHIRTGYAVPHSPDPWRNDSQNDCWC